MTMRDLLHCPLVTITRNADVAGLYDVEMLRLSCLRQFSSVECHIVIYPYSRRVSSGSITVNPFEEYAKDIEGHQKSAYSRIVSDFNKLFGLILGAVIVAIFAVWKPGDLVSIESVVSILGAFFIGKELWDEIDALLMKLTRKWPVRLQENCYSYRVERHTTLTNYSMLAKHRRYGKATLLPEKMDFITQSHSQTVRLWFDREELECASEDRAHLLSASVDAAHIDDFERAGYLFGLKLSLNRRILAADISTELFQSLDKGESGCLDMDGRWVPGGTFWRRTFTLGRVKVFIKSGVLDGLRLLEPPVAAT